MHSHTITLALAVGLAALVPSGALAQPAREPATFAQNLQSPDARDAAQTGQAPQTLQSPDARDAAAGRGTYNSPRVVVVKMPQSSSAVPESASAGGLDWADAGIGAGGLLGLGLLGAGGAFVVVHRKRAHHASPVAGL